MGGRRARAHNDNMVQELKRSAAVMALLVALFCAFFWMGFLVGKQSSGRAAAGPGAEPPPKLEQLRVSWTAI